MRLNSIRSKFTLICVFSVVFPVLLVSFFAVDSLKQDLLQTTHNRLTAGLEMKRSEISNYLNQLSNQIQAFSSDYMVVNAVNGFAKAFKEVERELNSAYDFDQKELLLKRYKYQREKTPEASKNAISEWFYNRYTSAKILTRSVKNSNSIALNSRAPIMRFTGNITLNSELSWKNWVSMKFF